MNRFVSSRAFSRHGAEASGAERLDPRLERAATRLAEAEAPGRRAYWRLAFREALADGALTLDPALVEALDSPRPRAASSGFVAAPPMGGARGVWSALGEIAAIRGAGAAPCVDLSALASAESGEPGGVAGFLALEAAARAAPGPQGASLAPTWIALGAQHPEAPVFYAGASEGLRRAALIPDALMTAAESGTVWRFVSAGFERGAMAARALLGAAAQGAAANGLVVVFGDKAEKANPLAGLETLACGLGGLALPAHAGPPMAMLDARAMLAPASGGLDLDEGLMGPLAELALRMLDDSLDLCDPPLEAQASEASAKRRVGLRLSHVAEALARAGISPGVLEWKARAERWFGAFQSAVQRASAVLAAEKGPYLLFDAERRLASPAIQALDATARGGLAAGLRCGAATLWLADDEDPAAMGEDSARLMLAVAARKRLDMAGPALLMRPAGPEAALDSLRAAWRAGVNGVIFSEAAAPAPSAPAPAATEPAPTPPPAPAPAAASPAARPWRLSGATYAIESPDGGRWLLTLNDGPDGRGRPIEALLMGRGEAAAALGPWPEALARVISVALAAGAGAQDLAKALQDLHDPSGQSLIEGRLASSLPAAVGAALARHGSGE